MFHRRIVRFRGLPRLLQGSTRFPITCAHSLSRSFRVTSMARSKAMKVAVLGAAGRTGSCLSLFLKQSCLIDELAIYDKAELASVALELSHIDTRCRVSYSGNCEDGLRETLEDAKIVVITAGRPCDSEQCSRNISMANADILLDYVPNVVRYCPRALLALATSPVNELVPLVVETYKKFGLFDHDRIFGITTLNSVTANTFAAETMGLEPECVVVPVIGGNCSKTCVPVFSQTKPCSELTHEEISKLTHAVRIAADKVAREYDGNGTSSLAMGFAAARFCTSLCKALRDERGIVEFAYCRSCVIPDVTYFAGPLELGPCGIQKYLGLPSLTTQECKLLASAVPHLREAIQFGEALALGSRGASTEVCPPRPDPCNQEISGKMVKSNNTAQPCPM